MTLLNNILPESRRAKLKALLDEGKTVRALEAHNGTSGIIANNARVEGQANNLSVQREFDAIWESSLTDSASKGHPDIEQKANTPEGFELIGYNAFDEFKPFIPTPLILPAETAIVGNPFCTVKMIVATEFIEFIEFMPDHDLCIKINQPG